MNVLVTGHLGFIGRHLTRLLHHHGVETVVFEGDAADLHTLAPASDVVMHLASFAQSSSIGVEGNYGIFRNNLLTTLSVAEYARRHCSRVVFASSSAVYRPLSGMEDTRVSEEHPLGAVSANGLSKLASENVLQFLSKAGGFQCVLLRIFNPYGPGQPPPFLIPYLIRQLKEKEPIELRNPCAERDFIFVEDVCDAFLKAALCSLPECSVPINIGTGSAVRVQEVLELLEDLVKVRVPISSSPGSTIEVSSMVADMARAHELLKWAPRYSLREGLSLTLKE